MAMIYLGLIFIQNSILLCVFALSVFAFGLL